MATVSPHNAPVTAHFVHLDGSSTPASIDAVPALLAELDDADDEHPDVSVIHESEWALGAFPSGKVIWENVEEDDEPRHMDGLSRAEQGRLFECVIRGDLATVQAQEWEPGY